MITLLQYQLIKKVSNDSSNYKRWPEVLETVVSHINFKIYDTLYGFFINFIAAIEIHKVYNAVVNDNLAVSFLPTMNP